MDYNKLFQMVVHIVGDDVGHFLLHLDEGIVQVVELGVLLEECHEGFVGAVGREFRAVLLEELASLIDELTEIVGSPEPHGLGEGIEEDEGAVAVVYELDEAAVHHLFAQDEVSQQGDLFAIEERQRLGCHLTANGIEDGVVYAGQEGICAVACCFLEF